MFDLYRKKIVILLITLTTVFTSEAQKRVNDILYQQDYDEKIVHFGYFIGPNFARYDFKFNQQFQQGRTPNPNYLLASPDVAGLLRFGGSVNFLVNDNFDFQTGLGASIYDRKVNSYRIGTKDTASVAQEGNTAWLDFPAHLKFKSERRRNTRMYMMAGFRFSAEIAARTKKCYPPCQDIGDKKKNDFMIEYGVGLEKFTPFAKITPELCFSHGLINLLATTSDPNRIGVTSMKSHTITLFIYFE
jgi:Outer membrane protein beta-barrel domain